MKIVPTPIAGAMIVELEPQVDERGWFARTFSRDEFAAAGLTSEFPQCSVSFNPRLGTLRGMHYQAAPHGECKLVRCTRGRAYDVILDLRRSSPGLGRWFARELAPDSGQLIYVPEGVAHGFQTLADETEISYLISAAWNPEAARGVRFDDPAFAIDWPLNPPSVISERDRAYPDFAG